MLPGCDVASRPRPEPLAERSSEMMKKSYKMLQAIDSEGICPFDSHPPVGPSFLVFQGAKCKRHHLPRCQWQSCSSSRPRQVAIEVAPDVSNTSGSLGSASKRPAQHEHGGSKL